MDEIIRGLFQSSHPDTVKRQVFKKLRLSGTNNKLRNLTTEQRDRLLDVCFQYLLLGKDFDHEEAVLLLKDYLPFCIIECKDTFSSSFVGNLIQGNFTFKSPLSNNLTASNGENHTRISIYRRIVLFRLLLNEFKAKLMKEQQGFVEIHVKSEAIRLMYNCLDHRTAAELSRFLTRDEECMPPSSRAFALCSLSIHAMSDYFPKADDGQIISIYIQDITDISTLIQRIWMKQPATLAPSLIEIFNIISTIGASVPEPSNALGCLVEFIPSEMIENVIRKIIKDSSVTDIKMSTALTRMVKWIGWPNTKKAHLWVLAFFYQLAAAGKFSLLINVTLKTIKQLFICLRFPVARSSAMAVLYHMLMSFQHSSEAFHIIVPIIPETLSIMQNDGPASNDVHMLQLINLSYSMMQLHTGFPELYGTLVETLKKYHKTPSEILKVADLYSPWKSYNWHGPQLGARSSETGKAGLVNLGNTCYINSVVQALYMIDEFRHSILKLRPPPISIIAHLANTFAYLLLTNRIAIEPKTLVEASRPPWFSSGGQQDCSEYLKYLLDCLKEEERSHMSSQNKDTSTHPDQDHLRTDSTSLLLPQSSDSYMKQQSFPSTSTLPTSSAHLSVVERLFHGTLKSSIQCSQCNFTSTREETFVDFALPLNKAWERGDMEAVPGLFLQTACKSEINSTSDEMEVDSRAFMDDHQEERKPIQVEEADEDDDVKKSHELNDLLHHSLADEAMKGDNQYYCSQCNVLRNAIKTTIFTDLPKYLILSLMRFTYNTTEQRRSKLLDNVEISQQIQVPLHKDGQDRCVTYSLIAIVVHSGTSADSGHYYSYARDHDSGRWCHFNDSHISFASFQSIKELTSRFSRDTAYVLIYSNNNTQAFQSSIDAIELVNQTIRDEIEADNLAFSKELEEASKVDPKSGSCHRSNILGWDNDDNPPPPPTCGGGGGDGHLSSHPPIC